MQIHTQPLKHNIQTTVMCTLSAKLTYVQIHIITHREKKITRNHRSLRQHKQCWNKQNLAENEASRRDPNNHQNKVCQLPGTVQRRSMGNWTGYEKCVFLLSTSHFDVSYRPEMNGKQSSVKMKEYVGGRETDKQRRSESKSRYYFQSQRKVLI